MRYLLLIIPLSMLGAGIADRQRDEERITRKLRPLLDAMREVESGGNDNAVGDGGKALGPYQIWKVYHKDAGGLDADYPLVVNREYAEHIMVRYWKRYAPSWDWEVLSRQHNGGPRGHKKKATLGYWRKVKKALRQFNAGEVNHD